MGPILELGPRVSAYTKCAHVCPTSLDARFQSASAVHLSQVGSLPPAPNQPASSVWQRRFTYQNRTSCCVDGPVRSPHFRLSWPAHPGTPLQLEAELLLPPCGS